MELEVAKSEEMNRMHLNYNGVEIMGRSCRFCQCYWQT